MVSYIGNDVHKNSINFNSVQASYTYPDGIKAFELPPDDAKLIVENREKPIKKGSPDSSKRKNTRFCRKNQHFKVYSQTINKSDQMRFSETALVTQSFLKSKQELQSNTSHSKSVKDSITKALASTHKQELLDIEKRNTDRQLEICNIYYETQKSYSVFNVSTDAIEIFKPPLEGKVKPRPERSMSTSIAFSDENIAYKIKTPIKGTSYHCIVTYSKFRLRHTLHGDYGESGQNDIASGGHMYGGQTIIPGRLRTPGGPTEHPGRGSSFPVNFEESDIVGLIQKTLWDYSQDMNEIKSDLMRRESNETRFNNIQQKFEAPEGSESTEGIVVEDSDLLTPDFYINITHRYGPIQYQVVFSINLNQDATENLQLSLITAFPENTNAGSDLCVGIEAYNSVLNQI